MEETRCVMRTHPPIAFDLPSPHSATLCVGTLRVFTQTPISSFSVFTHYSTQK